MNRLINNYTETIVSLMPEIESWQITGIRNALKELYCLAYQEGEMKGRLEILESKNLFDNYDYAD